jgi:hypothetical protein
MISNKAPSKTAQPKTPELMPNILLAKSSMPGMKDWTGSCHLVGHTAAVLQSVTILVDTLKDFWIPQFGLSCSFEELRATARLAAYLHEVFRPTIQTQSDAATADDSS